MKEFTITLKKNEADMLMILLMGMMLQATQKALTGDTEMIEVAELAQNMMTQIKNEGWER